MSLEKGSMASDILGCGFQRSRSRNVGSGLLFAFSAFWVPGLQLRQNLGIVNWVAVKELKLSYYIGKPYYLLYIPIMVT